MLGLSQPGVGLEIAGAEDAEHRQVAGRGLVPGQAEGVERVKAVAAVRSVTPMTASGRIHGMGERYVTISTRKFAPSKTPVPSA